VAIEIPSSVAIVEECSFEGCDELESCLIAQDSRLMRIGATAFAKCTSLRSFSIQYRVVEIGRNSFDQCIHLHRLKFQSSESLRRVGDRSLEDALEEFGVSASSGLFRIEIGDEEVGHSEGAAGSSLFEDAFKYVKTVGGS
jgi:hypothetical protein